MKSNPALSEALENSTSFTLDKRWLGGGDVISKMQRKDSVMMNQTIMDSERH